MGLTGMSWVGRAVVLWAVLAGLFLMHGAAPPADGCQGGVPVTAMIVTAMPVIPAAASASAAPDTSHPAATGPMSAACGCGMMCATRRPPDAPASAFVIPPASAAVLTTAPERAPAFLAAAFRRPCRPPGRQGLPLPLFLSVSRT